MIKSNQVDKKLDESRWIRWHFIRTFYLLEKEEIFLIYKKINDGLEVSPASWNKFVNSKELHDFVYTRVTMISEDMICAIGYSESVNNSGMEMHTDDFAIFIAMPMLVHDNISSIEQQTAIKRQITTRAFTTMLCHMFFKDLYGKPFTILKEDDGYFSLNEKYEYVRTGL